MIGLFVMIAALSAFYLGYNIGLNVNAFFALLGVVIGSFGYGFCMGQNSRSR